MLIDFGIVYETDGVSTADLYINPSTSLEAFDYHSVKGTVNINCETDDGINVQINRVFFNSIIPYKKLIKATCHDSIQITQEIYPKLPNESKIINYLHYLVLEGLEMEFCETTTQERTGRTKSFGPRNLKWDFTKIGWYVEMSSYHLDFYKDHETGAVIVRVDHLVNAKLTYERFLDLKHDFVSLLSFLNGAQISIRKECYGPYCDGERPTAQVDVIYSHKRIKNLRQNEYIVLNHHINRQHNLLNRVFHQNFEKFCEWNKKIDLNSIIFYLTGAIQNRSLEEQFFTLIIAFERLTALYAKNQGAEIIQHPSKINFKPVKEELFKVLDNHKSVMEPYFVRAKSVIGGLNQVQRLSTKDKMYGILTDLKIDVTPEIASLIDTVRNDAVHEGQVGNSSEEIWKNVFLLNELLHEIILRLIECWGYRNSTQLYGNRLVNLQNSVIHEVPHWN